MIPLDEALVRCVVDVSGLLICHIRSRLRNGRCWASTTCFSLLSSSARWC
jgi:imidazoleglycerol phosphate dehydratase HisB